MVSCSPTSIPQVRADALQRRCGFSLIPTVLASCSVPKNAGAPLDTPPGMNDIAPFYVQCCSRVKTVPFAQFLTCSGSVLIPTRGPGKSVVSALVSFNCQYLHRKD